MSVVIAIIVIAVLVGGIGLLVEGLLWLLFIAAALLLVGVVMGVLAIRRVT